MIALAVTGFVSFVAGIALPHRLGRPWNTWSALLGPLGLALFAAGLLGAIIPDFYS